MNKNKFVPMALAQEWDQRLKKSGFVESKGSLVPRGRAAVSDFDNVREYYNQASSYLHTGVFKDELEKLCWERHAGGMSMRAIAREVGLSVRAIFKRIDRVRKRAFLRD